MSYQVLARKWRPKNFSQLIGQDSVRQTLTNALKQNRLYPVLIFTGPRGTGKTSTARITAKSLRCQNQSKGQPCDQCEDCLLIGESRHLDVIEIDGASNNGVDAVRELRDTVAYMPSSGHWKIYIIDEVHMLSHSAFNALLKTLEEPPSHVIFIMATTESHKIPSTVLSRSQKLDFYLLPPLSIKEHLEKICKEESFTISKDILWLLAKQSHGSLRDAQSLLDQVITFCGDNIDKKEVIKILGLSDPQLLWNCLSALLKKKEEDIVQLIADLRTKGVDPKLFLQNLIESVSHLLFLKQNPNNNPPLVQASPEEIKFMKQEITSISPEELHFLFDMLLKGEREIVFCQNSELVLEVLLLRLCSAPRIEEIIPLNSFKAVKKTLCPPSQESQEKENKNPIDLKEKALPKRSPTQKSTQIQTSSFKTENSLKDFEQRFDFLEHLRKKDQSLASLIENVSFKRKNASSFCLFIPENFSYLKKKMEEKAFRKLLERELSFFLKTKENLTIEFLLNKSAQLSLREEKKSIEKNKLLKEAKNNPFVNQVKNLFDGKIKSVKKIDKRE
ncbi:MAG: DNA polymerase III subunit gamma/tau [Oligoflexia bacterium]|nr:DNA polymerase III subunit gamma/tau [Oligoflexia bacterium]